MTSAQMISYFDLMTDKVGTSYFLESEKYDFINKSQIEYVKNLLPSSEGGVVNMEEDQVVFNNISTLVFETSGLSPNGSGDISSSSVQTALNSASGSTEPWVYIVAVSWNGKPVRYTKHNNWYQEEQNSFKKGSSGQPKYRQLGTKFSFSPVDTTASVKFTLIKEPKVVSGSVNSDLPSHTHKSIVEMAVDKAILSIRDREYNETKK